MVFFQRLWKIVYENLYKISLDVWGVLAQFLLLFVVFPKMLSQTNSIDLNTRHGNILGCAEVIHALYLYARHDGRYRILQCIMNLWYLERKLHQPWLVFMRFSASILVDLKFGDVDFCGGRKTGEPGEKPLEQGREPTTNSTHIWQRARIKPGPNWWEANALTTVPSLLPWRSL